jgi:Bacterial pre-peptidase C-terminal domain
MDLRSNGLSAQRSMAVFSDQNTKKTSLQSFRFGSSSAVLRAEPGDSRSSALRINSSDFSRRDRVGEDEGDDYYRFDLGRRTEVRISVENREFFLGPSLRFRLQRSNGSTIEAENVRGNDEDTIRRRLDSGTYFIRVSSGGESVPYRLRFRR